MTFSPLCPICRSSKTGLLTHPLSGSSPSLVISVCEKCGHARRVDERDLQANLAIQRETFDGSAARPGQGDGKWPHRLALVAAEVRRIAGRSGKVLDIGCGPGAWLNALGDGWEKHGVEVSPAAAEIARTFAGAKVHCGPIEYYDGGTSDFDLISAFAVIEHVSMPESLVNWAWSHLRRGGILVLMTGDRESRVARRMGFNWPLYAPLEHVNYFSARSLCRLVEGAGFRIRRREWRFMSYEGGSRLSTAVLVAKFREIARMVEKPTYDHFYLYAQKP